MAKNVKLPDMPWSKVKDPIWPTTLFLLRRNLDAYPFPPKLSPPDAKEVLHKIRKSFSGFEIIDSGSLSPHQKELLFERFILSEGFEKVDAGSAFIFDDSSSFLGIINVEDHLHIHTLSFEHRLSSSWQKLSSLEQKLSKELSFAYSSRFGYLTKNPSLSGTALVVQAFLHLPTLLHLETFTPLIETLSDDLTVKGLGEENEYLADFVLLENKYTLGTSEESILESVQKGAETLKKAEASLRKNLNQEQISLLKDKIAKAFGLLSSARSLQATEALSSLSMIHLGKELDWLSKTASFDFFHLFFSSQRAHLAEFTQHEDLSKELLPSERATYIRKIISLVDPEKLFL